MTTPTEKENALKLCRELFEAWAHKEVGATKTALIKDDLGRYVACASTHNQWMAWQSAWNTRAFDVDDLKHDKIVRQTLKYVSALLCQCDLEKAQRIIDRNIRNLSFDIEAEYAALEAPHDDEVKSAPVIDGLEEAIDHCEYCANFPILPEIQSQEKVFQAARAYLQGRTQSKSVPDGWKLVPIEPTEDMEFAGNQVADALAVNVNYTGYTHDCATAEDVYKSMLSAAPPPPVTAQGQQGWMPIETAPKGQPKTFTKELILLLLPDGRVVTGCPYWKDNYSPQREGGGCDVISTTFGGYLEVEYSALIPQYPTHWMPLPAPPAHLQSQKQERDD